MTPGLSCRPAGAFSWCYIYISGLINTAMRSKPKRTRYFLFHRVNPKPEDYTMLVEVSETINAFITYVTECQKNRRILKGFIILRGQTTCVTGQTLHLYFPNFMLQSVSKHFHFNFEDIPQTAVSIGDHPYQDLKKTLFKDTHLSDFLEGVFKGSDPNLSSVRKRLFSNR